MSPEEIIEKVKGEEAPDFPWWNPQEDLKEDFKLHISLPTYNNSLNLLQDNGLRRALVESTLGDKLIVDFNFCGGDSLICRARDKLAGAFLASDAEWQLQIDNDIIFPYGLGHELAEFYRNWMDESLFNLFLNEGVFRTALTINAIDEIARSAIMSGQKIVGGYYFWRGGAKNFNESGSIFERKKGGSWDIEFKLRPDNYIYTNKISTGFLLTHRSVYEKIMEEFPDLEYDTPRNVPDKSTFAFYLPMVTKEKDIDDKDFSFYRSEDYAFSWRAEQVGFKPCLNMNLLLGHMGTHIFSWFDRPILQKLMIESYNHPQHEMERVRESSKD
jgi:hypothetical protein